MEIVLPSGKLWRNLLVYTHNYGSAFQGLALRELEDNMILLFSFYNARTFSHPKEKCQPIEKRRDLPIMCKENFWDGIIVFWRDTPGRAIKEGRLDPDTRECEFFFRDQKEEERQKPWMPICHCQLIGHVDAVL